VGLALWGLGRALRRNGPSGVYGATALALLVTFVLLRTAFVTTVETPEPRYILECFPALLAIGALAWLPPPSSPQTKIRTEGDAPEARDVS
jgi:hypothetical protein